MTTINALAARAYVQQYDVSTDLMSIEPDLSSDVQDVSTFGTATGTSYAVTLQNGHFAADGFDSTDLVAGIDAVLAPLQGLPVQMSLWPAGDAAGKRGYADDNALFTVYRVAAKVGSVVAVHLEWECNDGAALVTSVVPKTTTAGAATNTTAAVDNGVATTNGGAAFFRLFGGTSTGTAVSVFRVEHSPDNAAWATLASSTLATTGVQRVAIAAGTTIERYVRGVVTVPAGKQALYNVALNRA